MLKLEEIIGDIIKKGGESYSDTGRRNPIRKDTLAILSALMIAKQPKHILEVGTAYGVSTICMAKGAPDSTVWTIEYDENVSENAQRNFGKVGINNVKCFCGDARKVIPSLEKLESTCKFDVLFLDGEKSMYKDFYIKAKPQLASNTLIIADNVNDRRKECQDFLQIMEEDCSISTIISTECGLFVGITKT